MLVDMPVFYRAEAVPKGARNPRQVDFVESVSVEITEIDGQDAPLAVSGLSVIHHHADHTRWFEGSNWAPDDNGRTVFDREKWSSNAFADYGASASWARMQDGRSDRPEKPVSPEGHRRVDLGTRELEFGRIAAFAKTLALIDGRLYHRVDPPIYCMVGHETGAPWVAASFGLELMSKMNDYMSAGDLFMLDRREDLEMHVSKWGYDPDRLPTAPIIHIPEAVRFPDEAFTMFQKGGRVVDLVQRHLPFMSEGQGVSWYRLRDSVEHLGSQLCDRHGEFVADALQIMGNELREAQLRPSPLNGDTIDTALSHIETTLERWNLRPLDYAIQAPGY